MGGGHAAPASPALTRTGSKRLPSLVVRIAQGSCPQTHGTAAAPPAPASQGSRGRACMALPTWQAHNLRPEAWVLHDVWAARWEPGEANGSTCCRGWVISPTQMPCGDTDMWSKTSPSLRMALTLDLNISDRVRGWMGSHSWIPSNFEERPQGLHRDIWGNTYFLHAISFWQGPGCTSAL